MSKNRRLSDLAIDLIEATDGATKHEVTAAKTRLENITKDPTANSTIRVHTKLLASYFRAIERKY